MDSAKTKKMLRVLGVTAIAFIIASLAGLERGFAAGTGDDNVVFALTKRFSKSITPAQHPFWNVRVVGRRGGTSTVCHGSATAFMSSNDAIIPVSLDKVFSVCEIQPDTPYHNCVESFAAGQRMFLDDWALDLTVNGVTTSVMTMKNLPFEYSQNPNVGFINNPPDLCDAIYAEIGIVREHEDSCVTNVYMVDLSTLSTGSYEFVSELHDTVTGETLGVASRVINVVDSGVDDFGRTCN